MMEETELQPGQAVDGPTPTAAPAPTATNGPPAPGYWMAPDGSWHPPETSTAARPTDAGEVPSNGLATASLVVGIIGLCLFWLTGLGAVLGLLAVIFGAVGLSTARRHQSRPNEGRAWGGLVTGILAMVLSVGFVVAVLVLSSGAKATFSSVGGELDGMDQSGSLSNSDSDLEDINTNPYDGSCNPDRYIQDPDC